jgi:hypothetical protein
MYCKKIRARNPYTGEVMEPKPVMEGTIRRLDARLKVLEEELAKVKHELAIHAEEHKMARKVSL